MSAARDAWSLLCPQAKQGGGTPTRMLIDDSQWARGAYEALQTWRSTLFGRMADFYKRVEDVASRHGSRKIGRLAWEQRALSCVLSPG